MNRRALFTVAAVAVIVAVVVIFDLYPSRADISEGRYQSGEQVLLLAVNTCNATHFVSADETPDEVRVSVRAILRSGNDCQDLVEVELEQPLMDRAVVDANDGAVGGIPD